MRQKTKKIIYTLFGLLLFIIFSVWYFFPVLMTNWYLYYSDLRHLYNSDLNVVPITINNLISPPNNWIDLSVDKLTFKLPLSRYDKISGNKNYLYFNSEKGSFLISDIVPQEDFLKIIKENNLKYPMISYQEELTILKSSPSDISFFNPRYKNKHSTMNLVLKTVSIPVGGFGKILDVNADSLKAICIISNKYEKGYIANAYIYNKEGTLSFSIYLKNYKNNVLLETDLLSILGGMKVPDQMINSDKAKDDIQRIVKDHKKT